MKKSQHLADAVEARRIELKMSPKDLIARSGLSPQAVYNVRQGKVRDYHDSLKIAITDALGWSTDSIDRLLAGNDPVVEDDPLVSHSRSTDVVERFDSVDAQLRQIRADLGELMKRAVEVVDLLDPPPPGAAGDRSPDPGRQEPSNRPSR